MSDPLVYGIVGASSFARFCRESWRDLPDLRAASVWSRTPEHAAAFAEAQGLRSVGSLELLLADRDVDLVHIATTPDQHAGEATAALRAGKHVLTEKPVATELADADLALRTADREGRRLGVNFMMRHGPLWSAVRDLVRSRILGDVVHAVVLNLAGDDGLPEGHWFWDEGVSGGILIEHGVHHFDLLRSWLGEGEVLSAYSVTRPGSGVDRSDAVDQMGCAMRYRGGATATFYHGFHQSPQLDRQEVRLVLERGTVTLRGWVADELDLEAVADQHGLEAVQAWAGSMPDAQVSSHALGAGETTSRRAGHRPVSHLVTVHWRDRRPSQEVYASALRSLMADFLAAVRDSGHAPRVSGEDGRAALALAVAATSVAT